MIQGSSKQPVLIPPLRLSPTQNEIELLDQRLLPAQEKYVLCRDHLEVAEAIRSMVVRGAPAIGIVAAYGVALGVLRNVPIEQVIEALWHTRPTAVNLHWALSVMKRCAEQKRSDEALSPLLWQQARAIWDEDVEMCQRIGQAGAELIPHGNILTHCNAGCLATGGFGTAVGVIRVAYEQGRIRRVFATETRPYMQGVRITAFELQKLGIPVTVICESAAGHLLARGEIQSVVVGADRIARNGDVANKVGTYPIAVVAREHNVPFFVAAPYSTLDSHTARGADIAIEERPGDELSMFHQVQVVPTGVAVRNIAFDVTSARFVHAIITERGAAHAPYEQSLFGVS